MPPRLSSRNPFEAYPEDQWLAFEPDEEPTFKGMQLRSTKMRVKRSHANAPHTWTDTDGGDTEMLGRDPYEVELETVFCGAGWRERFGDACWLFESEKSIGVLTLPDGPSIDARWIEFPEDRDLRKSGTNPTATFRECSTASAVYVPDVDPRAMMRQSIPAAGAATLPDLVEGYDEALQYLPARGPSSAVAALAALDTAAATLQAALALDTEASIRTYTILARLRATAIRAFPAHALRIDISEMLRAA
jgi:hypothetical protein